jgi:hypothetical protein
LLTARLKFRNQFIRDRTRYAGRPSLFFAHVYRPTPRSPLSHFWAFFAAFAARFSACFCCRRAALILRSIPAIYFAYLRTISRPLSFSRFRDLLSVRLAQFILVDVPSVGIHAARNHCRLGAAVVHLAGRVVAACPELDGSYVVGQV